MLSILPFDNLKSFCLFEFGIVATEIDSLNQKSQAGQPVSSAEVQIAQIRFDEAVENYLNSLDCLCASILRGLIPEDEYRADYRQGISEAITQHGNFFGPATRFRNIKKIHDKQADQ